MSKKNIIFLVITIIILVFSILVFLLKDNIINLFNDNKESSYKEDHYKNYKNTSNFKLENLNRYITYHTLNKELSYEDVTTYVNIGLDKDFYSEIKSANMSKGILILVNKYLKLDSDYEPNDLEEINNKYFISGNINVRKMRKEAKEQFEKLSEASILNGTPVYGQSAYREYNKQVSLYNNAVNQLGQELADNDTARPGHSEHQTGLTIDVSSTKDGNMLSFHNTKSFDWMINNAHKYGFILRYTEGYEDIHGFMYESWHYRYVGVEVATDMYENYKNMTFDEYYYKFIDDKEI